MLPQADSGLPQADTVLPQADTVLRQAVTVFPEADIVFLWVIRLLAASYQCREVGRRGQTTGGDMADFSITAGMVGP